MAVSHALGGVLLDEAGLRPVLPVGPQDTDAALATFRPVAKSDGAGPVGLGLPVGQGAGDGDPGVVEGEASLAVGQAE